MFKSCVLMCLVLILTACGKPQSEPQAKLNTLPQPSTEAFHSQAMKLLEAINTGQALTSLTDESASLVSASKALLVEFMDKHPQCTDYLSALKVIVANSTSLTLEKITSKQPSDLKLPQFSEPICYHAKAILVHAVTVQALSMTVTKNEPILLKPEHEIISALAHYDQVKKSLIQKPQN